MRLRWAAPLVLAITTMPVALPAQQSVAVPRSSVVDVSLASGTDAIVTGWDREEVSLENVQGYEVVRTSSGAQVRRVRRAAGDDVPLRIRVPSAARIVVNGTSNDIDISSLTGNVEVRVNNGDVIMRNVGRVFVSSFNGDIVLDGAAGDVRIETASGDIALRNLQGAVNVTTTSGDIDVTASRAQSIRMETIAGDVSFAGTIADGSRNSIATHAGSVRLVLPAATGAVLELQTFAGSLESKLPMTVLPNAQTGGSSRRIQLGNGGGFFLSVVTFNGNIGILTADSR